MVQDIKILLVDDDPLNLEMLEVMLSSLDCCVLRAADGQQALNVLEQHPDTDIVLLDLQMPVMDGFETLSRLKRSDRFRTIPVIVITADKREVHRTLGLGADDFLVKPYDLEELKLRVMNHVRAKKLADITHDMNQVLESEVVKRTAALQEALELSRNAEYEISLRLGMAAEFRDQETGLHTRRVSEFSKLLAILAGLSEEESEVLRYASPLHDVGKIGIPDSILLKPGKLSDSELAVMRQHTLMGGKILGNAGQYPVLTAASTVALQHHEKWDGSGYPEGLRGEEINIYGRIVMVVDVFDALTSERPYKKAFPLGEARTIMADGRGEFFDPRLLDIFLENFGQFVAIMDNLRDVPEEKPPSDHEWQNKI